MPRDRDEDVSSPLSAASPAARSPVPTAPASAPPLAWGVCGIVNHPGELASSPGRTGVIRYVNNGVEYIAPPLATGWRKAPDEGACYEMVWEGDPARARSLLQLQKELDALKRSPGTDPDHPLLRQLNSVAMNLLAAAGTLHDAGWGLGLLRPDNVLIRPRGGELDVVLVDLGFTWRGTFGPPPWKDSPGRPDWLADRGLYAWLWDREPDRQQFAAPSGSPFPPPGHAADVRTLGRLFAWLLTGQPAHELRPLAGNDVPDCWPVLCDAAAGRIPTASDLASRLSESPLSEYIVPPPIGDSTDTGPPGRWRLFVILATLVVAGGAATALYLRNREPELVQSPPPTDQRPKDTPQPKTSTGGGDLFNLFDAAMKSGDLDKALEHLKEILKSAPKERSTEVEARRQLALGEWMKSYKKANLNAEQPALRYDAARAMAALSEQWKAISEAHPSTDPQQREREKQCLDFVSLRARELGAGR